MTTKLFEATVYKGVWGMARNRHDCPVARCMKLADPDVQHVRVDAEFITYSRHSTAKRYKFITPPKAVAFINAFDNGGPKRGFRLILTTAELISVKPVGSGSSSSSGSTGVSVGASAGASADNASANTTTKVRRSRRPSTFRRRSPAWR